MSDDDDQSQTVRQLHLAEAKLLAATRAQELLAIIQDSPTSESAVSQIMRDFTVSEEQAAIILDSQFRIATLTTREQIEKEIESLNLLIK